MASSIVHLAITNELAKRIAFTDTNRLKFGAIVVDAGVGGNQNGRSHLKVVVLGGEKKTYDLDRFRTLFGKRMLSDDLYMGYYLHLVQDSLYRKYVYGRYHWNPMIPGNVERLHKDYVAPIPFCFAGISQSQASIAAPVRRFTYRQRDTNPPAMLPKGHAGLANTGGWHHLASHTPAQCADSDA